MKRHPNGTRSAVRWVVHEPLDGFVVPEAPAGFVLHVLPYSATSIETTSLRHAEALSRGARTPAAVIVYGPSAHQKAANQ